MIRMKLNCDKKINNSNYYKVQIVLFLINLNFITSIMSSDGNNNDNRFMVEVTTPIVATTPDDNSIDFEALKENFTFDYTSEPFKIRINANFNEQQMSHLKLRKLSDPKSTSRAANENNLSNLRPCTKYNITAEIKNPENATQKFMHSQIISTSYATPNTLLTMDQAFENRIYLRWDTENRECQLRSEMQVKRERPGVATVKKIDISKAHELTITDLKPCTKYHISLVTVNVNNTMVQNITKVEETSYIDPGEVDQINYTKHQNFVTLNWQPPIVGRTCVRNYTVKYVKKRVYNTKLTASSWQELTVLADLNQLKIANLPACEAYVFSIAANNQSSIKLKEFQTDVETPGQVTNIRIDPVTKVSVRVSWDPPEKNPFCVYRYCVSVRENQENCTIEQSLIIPDLEPCMNYTLQIKVQDKNNVTGVPVEKLFEMEEDKPSEVRDLTLTSGVDSKMIFSWKTPAYAVACITMYRYEIWYTEDEMKIKNDSSVYSGTTNNMEVEIDDLIACTDYEIQIIASSARNDSNRANLEFKSQEKVSQPPKRPETEAIRDTSIKLISQYADDKNRCKVQFVKFICKPVFDSPDAKEFYSIMEIEDNREIYRITVCQLKPVTRYNCSALIKNSVSWSAESEVLEIATGEGLPGPPQNLNARAMGNTTIEVNWEGPERPNGKITQYRLSIYGEPSYYVPSTCGPKTFFNDSRNDTNLAYTLTNGLPHYKFQFQVSASNGAGVGEYTQSASVVTWPSPPERISKIKLDDIIGPFVGNEYNASVNIRWAMPCRMNGILKSFEINIVGERADSTANESYNKIIEVGEPYQDEYEYNETGLKPEYSYRVNIFSVVQNAAKSEESVAIIFNAPAGIPLIEKSKAYGKVDIPGSPDPKFNALITFPDFILDSKMGEIKYIALLVSEGVCQEDPNPTSGLFNASNGWPDLLSYEEARKKPCVAQYQTTPAKWLPAQGGRNAKSSDSQMSFTIGKEDSCKPETEYCNGPLKAGTNYSVIVRLFTQSGYSDSMKISFKTDDIIAIYTIVISVLGCLIFSFVLGLLIFMRKNMKDKMRSSVIRDPDSATDIPASKFSENYNQMTTRDHAVITNEYKVINAFDAESLGYTTMAAKQNEVKNRYTNIHPYDHNRVLLGPSSGTNDYINASFVNGYKHPSEYIATQGPKYESTFDFWRMLLQCRVEVVVMLTQLVENDREKCYQYYPKFNEKAIYNDIHVKCTQEINLHIYVRRLFEISRDHEQWCCTHYCYQKWPDHGVPQSPSDLIKFTKIIRSERKIPTSPVIVHCSAGVGRTGTFIALDIIIQRLQKEKKINIFSTVQELRRQRVKMVQICDQYKFLYQCALELAGKNSKKGEVFF